MRFRDLLGKKPEPDESTGRLITPSDSARHAAGETRRDVGDQPSPRLTRSAEATPEAEASLADLFARLLAAEQGEPAPPPSSALIRLSDADVERLAAGVAARFVKGPLRDEVRQIVVEVAERLVREEIARIRHAAESQQP